MTPLLAAYAVARLCAVLAGMTTGSIVAYVGYPGGAAAQFPFSVADRPFYFGMAMLDYAAGAIVFGGAALAVAIGSWWRLRNLPRCVLWSAVSANWGRFWIVVSFTWWTLTATFPLLSFFSML